MIPQPHLGMPCENCSRLQSAKIVVGLQSTANGRGAVLPNAAEKIDVPLHHLQSSAGLVRAVKILIAQNHVDTGEAG